MIHITRDSLDPVSITSMVRRDANGAVVTFLGTTRRFSEGKNVLYLEYEAYETMAIRKLEAIGREVRSNWGIEDIAIFHRIGRLEIEDISLVVALASPHRKQAFHACSFVVDKIKENVPIWKKEVFEDGEAWVGCQSHQDHTVSTSSGTP